MIHPTSDVQSKNIGHGTMIWQFCVVLPDAVIGEECNICAHVFIENDVVLGNRVTIKSGVQIWDGLRLEDDVFIGPNATFTNDLRPRSKGHANNIPKTFIKQKATIGANATILPGIEIGEFAMVGAGAIVTESVPARALVIGSPAKIIGWLNEDGSKMSPFQENIFLDSHGEKWTFQNGALAKVS